MTDLSIDKMYPIEGMESTAFRKADGESGVSSKGIDTEKKGRLIWGGRKLKRIKLGFAGCDLLGHGT